VPAAGTALGSEGVSAQRLVWLLGGVFLVLSIVYVGLGRWRGGVEWQRLRREAALAAATIDAGDESRPVLWGEAAGGSAWDAYERALALLPSGYEAHDLAHLARVEGAALAGVPCGEPRRKGPSLATALDAHRAALAALEVGAHRTDVRGPIEWANGFNRHNPDLLKDRALANAAVLAAIAAARAGRGLEAVQLLLDVLQFGRDRMQTPVYIDEMIGCAVVQIASRDALHWSNLPRHLGPEALGVLEEGLALLDASLPLWSEAFMSETALFAYHLDCTPAALDEVVGALTWSSWRHGFSPRLSLASTGLARLRLAHELSAATRSKDALDVPAIEARFAALREASPRGLTGYLANLESPLRNRLHTIALVRLLRMAAQFARGAEVVALPDPTGGVLQWSVDPEGDASFWSDHDHRVRLPVRR